VQLAFVQGIWSSIALILLCHISMDIMLQKQQLLIKKTFNKTANILYYNHFIN